MEKYDVISVVGEGSYGMVMRCRHRESGQYVAIKKFLETEDDPTVRKMALREIRMLKKLRHENLVNMLEVFRRKKRFFLVFEYLEHTVLEQLESRVGGLGFVTARKYCYQVLRALDFIHSHAVIHRDIKPENVLVSRLGIIKLCDFGFARPYAENETFTDYVATRWYRSPELLVGDPRYGKEVDIWAVGCLYAEMMTGEPLFPGESDIDQLFQIIRVVGKLNARHQLLVTRNAMFKGMKQEQNTSLHQMFPDWTHDALDFLQQCLKMDGQQQRPDTATLLVHDLFTGDNFHETFLVEMRAKLQQEMQGTPLLKRMPSYGSGRKIAAETKKSGGPEGKKSGSDDRFAPSSKLNSNASQIGLSLVGTNSKPNSSAAQRRMSTSNGEEVGLNLAALRQYLHQHHKPPQKQMININNLIFKDVAPAMTSGHRARIVSAKIPTKSETTSSEKASTNMMDNVQTSTSPVHFQSLQTESILDHNTITDHHHAHVPLQHQHHQPQHQMQQMKRLSPVSVSNLSVSGIAPAPPYFSHRRSSNILGLQQVAAQKSTQKQTGGSNPLHHQHQHLQQHHQHQQQHHQQQTKKRERLIDVALMPLTGSTADATKDISPRLLPPPWLTGNLKITTQQEGKSVHQIGKRGMTDWKSTAASNTNATGKPQHSTTPSAASTCTTIGATADNAAVATSDGSGFLTDLLLPTCPGATGVSPYKPSRMHNKLKLSPIMAAGNSGAVGALTTDAQDSYVESALDVGRK